MLNGCTSLMQAPDIMKLKTTILTLTLSALSLIAIESFGQETTGSGSSQREQERADSLQNAQAKTQQEIDAQRLEEVKKERNETKAKAKEAQRVEAEANAAAKESKNALRAEKKAQKARKQADKQAKKAEQAIEKSNQN